jgi:hypothetical protein
MTFGSPQLSAHRFFAVFFALLCTFPFDLAWALDLPQLMQVLAQNKGGKTTFVERKYLAMLDEPVESSGELRFDPPYRLERRTLKPRVETVVLEKEALTVSRGKTSRTLSLTEYPELASLIESIRATLAGDQKALERYYRVGLTGALTAWQLVLTPKEVQTAKVVKLIRLSGQRELVSRIDVELADGDMSIMTIAKPQGIP